MPYILKQVPMSPSAIVLNVSGAIFLALFLVFASFLFIRYKKWRNAQQTTKEAKEIPLFAPQAAPMAKRKLKYKLAQAE